MRGPPDGESTMSVVTMVEMPWELDVPASTEAPETVDDNAAMTRGVLVGLGVSLPVWMAIAWIGTSVGATIFAG
jgi:hypothetical protein